VRLGAFRVDPESLAEQPLGLGLIFGARPGEVFEAAGRIGVGSQAGLLPGGGGPAGRNEQAGEEDRSR
jgi:hypothetical protein